MRTPFFFALLASLVVSVGCGDDTDTTTTNGAGASSAGGMGAGATGGQGGAGNSGTGGAGANGGGGAGSGGNPSAGVVINEVAPDGDPQDWVELKNIGAAQVDISSWYFTDDDPTHIYTFPAGTTVDAGDYLVVERFDGAGGAAPDTQFDFGLNNEADAVMLYDEGDAAVDATTWDVAAPGIEDPSTWSRVPDGTGAFSVVDGTQGVANQ